MLNLHIQLAGEVVWIHQPAQSVVDALHAPKLRIVICQYFSLLPICDQFEGLPNSGRVPDATRKGAVRMTHLCSGNKCAD